jgi:hypothetical protein
MYPWTDSILLRDAFRTVRMDGIWAKYWFIVVWPIEAWSVDLFTRICAFTSHRLRERNGLRSRIAKGISKYHRSSAEYVSTLSYSFVIASLISASGIAQEAARFVSCSTEFRCSHISWAKSHNSITVLRTILLLCHCPPQDVGSQIQPIASAYWGSLSLPDAIQCITGHQLPVESIHVVTHVHCSHPV